MTKFFNLVSGWLPVSGNVLADYKGTVTKTVIRTRTVCPCDKSASWQSWRSTSISVASTVGTTSKTMFVTTTTVRSSSDNVSSTSIRSTLSSSSVGTTSSSITSKSSSTTSSTSGSTASTSTSSMAVSTSTSSTTSSTTITMTTTTTTTSTSSSSTTTTTSTTSACMDLGVGNAAAARAAFTSAGIIPTLIPGLNPTLDIGINYDGKTVYLGNQFTTAQTLNAPAVVFNAELGFEPATTKYSFFLIDPDVPNLDAGALRMAFLHWEVADAESLCAPDLSRQTVAVYQALTPASTQQHRYTFLIYRQPLGYIPDVITPQTRLGFDINAYAAKGGLTLVGGNFLREAINNV